MSDELKKSFNNVFGWRVIDGKANPPDFDFPEAVWKRINFFVKEYENGLTLEGALRFVLADDEEKCISEYNLGGMSEWPPVTPEFIEWRDSQRNRSMELAVALIYGPMEEE